MGAGDARRSTPSIATSATSANGDFQRYGRGERGIAAPTGRPRADEHEAVERGHRQGPGQVRGRSERGRSASDVRHRSQTSMSLVGGFPCQDYSVARTLRQAHGLVGKKGVLWWEIHRLLRLKLATGRPVKHLFLENVDRLHQVADRTARARLRGDARIAGDLGYEVEWRVVNAADYGFPQKRRRVFIIGRLGRRRRRPDATSCTTHGRPRAGASSRGRRASSTGRRSRSTGRQGRQRHVRTSGRSQTPFGNAGVMRISATGAAQPSGRRMSRLSTTASDRSSADVLEADADVPAQFFVERRRAREVAVPQGREEPDANQPRDRASSTPTTRAPSHSPTRPTRPRGRSSPAKAARPRRGSSTSSRPRTVDIRRLTPRELERLDGFPGDWTTGMSDGKRAFMMGNALVVGVVERIARRVRSRTSPVRSPSQRSAVGLVALWPDCSFRTRRRAARPFATSCGPTAPATPGLSGAFAQPCARRA